MIVNLPFLDRPVCLPVAAALCTKHSPSKQVLACRLVTAIAAAAADRQVHVVADAWYAGADGAGGATIGAARHRGLREGVTLTSRLRANAALHTIAEPIPAARGRPRRIGAKLGTPAQVAATAAWTQATVRRYGRTDSVDLAQVTCLWYGVYRSRAVRPGGRGAVCRIRGCTPVRVSSVGHPSGGDAVGAPPELAGQRPGG
ncbi:transposase, partial [Phytohabitans suffuscus]